MNLSKFLSALFRWLILYNFVKWNYRTSNPIVWLISAKTSRILPLKNRRKNLIMFLRIFYFCNVGIFKLSFFDLIQKMVNFAVRGHHVTVGKFWWSQLAKSLLTCLILFVYRSKLCFSWENSLKRSLLLVVLVEKIRESLCGVLRNRGRPSSFLNSNDARSLAHWP